MATQDELQDVQDCWDEARRAFGDIHRVMERERRFSDGEHYLDDVSDVDLGRIRPKTEALARVIDFKLGKVTGGPMYFEARPTDPAPDPNAPDDVTLCEAARWLVESNINNPCNRYTATRTRLGYAGYAYRMGVAALDYHRDVGLHGECLWSIVPSDSVMWAPGFVDPHDPRCPWLIDVQAVPLSEIRRKKGWKNAKDIQPDDGARRTQETRADRPLGQVADFGHSAQGEETATIVKLWKRFDPAASYREKTFDELPEEARYMVCGTPGDDGAIAEGCGYMTPPQGEAQTVYPELASRAFSPTGEGGCPTCGGDMTRVDGMARGEMVSSYGRGRLIIAAPYSNVVAYGGKWPFRLRSFPYWFYRPSVRAHLAIPPCETTRKWSLQALDDASLRMGYEQMNRNRDLTLMPRLGLEDATGNPYDWLTSDGPAFYTADAPLGPNSVTHFQGSGLNPAFVAWRQMIRNTFREDEGTNDFSPGAEGPKDITATTMQIYEESGNVPLDMQKRLWQEEESLALGILFDMMIETMSEERMTELRGQEGPMVLALLRARSAHIQVLDQPSLSRLDGQKLDALARWYALPPPLRTVAARRMGISPADVREVEQAEQAMMQQQQQAAMAGAMPPPGGGPPPEPTAVGSAGGF